MTIINVILGSSRPASLGRGLFKHLEKQAPQFANDYQIKLNFIDLADSKLPFFYEAIPPMDNPHRVLPENEQKWIDEMQAADGYLFLVPEYNHAAPAVLKNALDFLAFEVKNKPAKVVTYSNNGRGGQFAFLSLLPTFNQLGLITLPKPAIIGKIDQNFDEQGNYQLDAPAKSRYQARLAKTIHEIAFYSKLLKENPFKESHLI